MAKQCTYIERNRKEQKCMNYFISHAGGKTRYMCRLSEWKLKKGRCPYDSAIYSKSLKNNKIIKSIRDKNQLSIEKFK